jgi:hypothetical protein
MPGPEWIGTMTDESLKNDPALQDFKSVDDLAKSFISTKALVGKKGVILPGDGAKDEEWNPVWDALGRPTSPDGYKLPSVQMKDGVKLDEESIKDFRAYAHKHGIPQRHFEKVMEYRFNQQVKQAQDAEKSGTEARQAGETAMRQEFGAKYDENMANFKAIVKALGKDLELPDDPSQYDQRLVRLVARAASHMSEGTIGEFGMQKGGALTPEEAKAQISKIRGDKDHPHNVLNHPEHKKAVDEMSKLYVMANPGKGQI